MADLMQGEDLIIPPNTLVFYVDDFGDERLNDRKNPIFAFGGVACVAEFHVSIARTWQAMKCEIFPQVRGPLHAKTHLRDSKLTNGKRAAVLAAMAHLQLARLGTVITCNTVVALDKVVMVACLSLVKRLENVALGMIQLGLWSPWRSPCSSVLIFEHSSRLAKKIERNLPDLVMKIDDITIPIAGCFMPKHVVSPFLEMADFTVNTIGRNIRHQLVHGRGGCTVNFQALFRDVGSPLANYIEVTHVT